VPSTPPLTAGVEKFVPAALTPFVEKKQGRGKKEPELLFAVKPRTGPAKDDAVPASSSPCRTPAQSRTPASSTLRPLRRCTILTAASSSRPRARGELHHPRRCAVDPAIEPRLNRAL
jgi:hypothetical protein